MTARQASDAAFYHTMTLCLQKKKMKHRLVCTLRLRDQHVACHCGREVVERRVYTVTGERASEAEVDRMIETGESETIFQKAILEQGRGHVRTSWHDLCPEFVLLLNGLSSQRNELI